METNDKAGNKLSYGQYIVSTVKSGEELKSRDRDYMASALVSWASQLSFDPEMIMIAVELSSDLNETIDYSGRFSLHILDEEHSSHAKAFSEDTKFENGKVNGLAYSKEDGFLKIEEFEDRLDCQVEKSFNAGDHTIYIAKVVDKRKGDTRPMINWDNEMVYSGAN